MFRICSVFAAGTLLFGVQSLNAQTVPMGDAVMKRIWSIGMDSSRLPVLANQLLDSIGPRLTGSPGQKNGNNWLVQTYKSWGIEATNEPYGTWRGWRRGPGGHLKLLHPWPGQTPPPSRGGTAGH